MSQCDIITVVSGLPRSGTSLMMQMLEAGGLEPLTDGIRTADTDNPRGYYELEEVKGLAEDSSWLEDAHGKAVKVISMLLYDLPPTQSYRVVFMERNMDEILASQRAMLERRGTADDLSDEQMRNHFQKHLDKLETWLEDNQSMQVIKCDYNELIASPGPMVKRVAAFLEHQLDTNSMMSVIDSSLYRQRS